MDPIITAIVAALVNLSKDTIEDGYGALVGVMMALSGCGILD